MALTPKKPKDGEALRLYALRLVAAREYTRHQLRTKLTGCAEELGDVEPLLDTLEASSYVSDARFAEAYIRMRRDAGKGPVAIRYELQQKGVSEGLIEANLDPGTAEWDVAATEARRRRFSLAAPPDFPAKAKQMRHLQARGFTPEQITHAMAQTPDLAPDSSRFLL